MTTGKNIALTRRTFLDQVVSLLFNMLSRLVVTVLPRSKHLLISWLQSQSAVIWKTKIIKSVTVSIFFRICLPQSYGTGCCDLRFLNVEFKPAFSLPSFTFIKRFFSSSAFCHQGGIICISGLLIFLLAIFFPCSLFLKLKISYMSCQS